MYPDPLALASTGDFSDIHSINIAGIQVCHSIDTSIKTARSSLAAYKVHCTLVAPWLCSSATGMKIRITLPLCPTLRLLQNKFTVLTPTASELLHCQA